MTTYVDTSELRRLSADLAGAGAKVGAQCKPAVAGSLREVQLDAQALAPKRTSRLATSISVDVDADGMGGDVGPTVDYGADVEYGTHPHVIRADSDGALVFAGPLGGLVFAEEVHHPGNAPEPFMGPAFDRGSPALEDRVGDLGEGIL